jgi:Saccharopine dehydrogenase NADP binding domain
MTNPKIVILGGYGTFGSLIAEQLAGSDAQVVIAGRDAVKGGAFATSLKASFVRCDARNPASLKAAVSGAKLVINASGPFRAKDYSIPQTCIDQGCNYIDLGDGREYVAGIAQLHESAKAHKVQREILHAQPDGLLRCFPFGPPARCPTCAADAPLPKGKQSVQRWQLDLGRPISRMIAADVTGEGRMAVLFGGGDGKLHALGERDGKPRLLWYVPLGRRVGEPVLVDLDGDGRPTLLVAAEDGRLYCLKGKGKAP